VDSDDDVLRWAEEWVNDPDAWSSSDADLAEAVRVKFSGDWYCTLDQCSPALEAWILDGPIAFLRAVKEVVDGQ
jgi:hypothetical protein